MINLADQEAITLTVPLVVERSMGVLVKTLFGERGIEVDDRPANPYYQEIGSA
jgi:hypothetical protein